LQKFSVMHTTATLNLNASIQSNHLLLIKRGMFFQIIEEACFLLLVEKKENQDFQNEISTILEKAISHLEKKRIQFQNQKLLIIQKIK